MYSKILALLFLSYLLCIGAGAEEDNSAEKSGKQLGNLQFAIPAFGLFQGGSGTSRTNLNLFALGGGGKSTVTRTVISTVATVTIGAFRTCTQVPAAFMPCAGRKRRAAEEEIQSTPSLKIIIDKTEITEPHAIAEILHLKNPNDLFGLESGNGQQDADAAAEATTTVVKELLERNIEVSTVLYSSQDEEVISLDDQSGDSKVTTETPYLLDDNNNNVEDATTTEPLLDDDDKARRGLGSGGGGTTVTSTIPVTHVVSTAVTAAMQTLTVSYAGCSPPGVLPVIGSMC